MLSLSVGFTYIFQDYLWLPRSQWSNPELNKNDNKSYESANVWCQDHNKAKQCSNYIWVINDLIAY